MFKRSKLSQAVIGAIAATSVCPAVHAKGKLAEVIVTATKRAESMQDIPVTVTALQSNDLKDLRINDFGDYIQYLPNVVSQGTGPGQNEIYIRGAATSQTIITLSSVQGLQPSVALYLDEQPVAMQGRNLDIYAADIKRVEVLPGPQGTLFGASSQAGTVRLITNKPNHDEFQAGLDFSIASTKGGDMSNAVQAYLNLPITDDLAVRIVGYNDNQGGWIDNILNDPSNGGWGGSALVIDRISGGGVLDNAAGNTLINMDGNGDGKVDQTSYPADIESLRDIPNPRNDQFVKKNFNDATYTGGRFGVSYLINDDWDVLVQHTQQSLNTDGVWAYDPNLPGKSSVNRFAPDNNKDDFGLTTWTLKGRLNMLNLIYTGGYLNRDITSSIDYTFYTNGGLFSAYYVCYPGDPSTAGFYDACYDPSKFYKESSTNTRMTHEFRINTPDENRWRVTAGVFYDVTELGSTGLFKIASTADPYFSNLARTLAAPPGTEGTNTNGGPFPPEISFVNDVTRTDEQIAVFGQIEFDILPNVTASFGARWYNIDDKYKGATTTVNVTQRLEAFGAGTESALQNVFGAAGGTAMYNAIQSGQLDVSNLNPDGVLNASDTIFRAALDWRVNEKLMVFTTFSQGFRPPVTNRVGGGLANNQTGVFQGFRIPVSSQTDSLDNYEVGFKADLLDRTLRLNVTGYYSDISNLQTSRFDPTNINFLWFADNVGDARIYGADGDFVWLPTDNLTISGAFSVLHSEITRLNKELRGIAPPVGSELPFSPGFSGNLRARYEFELPAFGRLSGLTGHVSGTVSYTGESLSGMKMDAYVVEDTMRRVYGVSGSGLSIKQEAATFAGQPGTPGQNGAPVTNSAGGSGFRGGRYKQGDYALFNLAFGLSKDNWSGEFFIDNVLDENANVYVDTQQFTPHVVTNRPRTFGFRMSYDY